MTDDEVLVQVVDHRPTTNGAMFDIYISLGRETHVRPLPFRFRLIRHGDNEPDPIVALAAIDSGANHWWQLASVRLRDPSKGKLSADARELALNLRNGETFRVTWDFIFDGVATGTQVHVQPWLMEVK